MAELMNSVVDEICNSLENDPDRWVIASYTLDDKKSGIKYWIDTRRIADTWDRGSANNVFSYEQGSRIYDSYIVLKNIKGSEEQRRVISSMKPKVTCGTQSKEAKSWWKFWR